MIKLTKAGKLEIKRFIKELETKKKELTDTGKDTADSITLPDEQCIVFDIEVSNKNGEYCESWTCTDNNYGLILRLRENEHYIIRKDKI